VAPPSTGRPLTVGAVVRDLAEEFPDITVSKIRFLEAEGLVTPSRTASGYRQFTAADVERIRYVLRAQRDRFWPLRVIRDRLESIDRGIDPGDEADSSRPRPAEPTPDSDVPDAATLLAGATLRLTPQELAGAADLEPEAVAALTRSGLLVPDSRGLHGESDLRVARAAAGLAAYGVEARHLRAFRTAADREAGLVEQAVGGRRGSAADRERAEVAHLCLTLHAALLRRGLGDSGG
jgi:DNA-binding transcriptional MerR regulator